MKYTGLEIDNGETLQQILVGSLEGRNAHLSASRALGGLKLDFTGKKILNTPYTIWQLLKHINYWQDKFIARLKGEDVTEDRSWTEGWEETYNASSEEELGAEIKKLISSLDWVKKTIYSESPWQEFIKSTKYETPHYVLQTMSSHLSYQ